MDIFEPNLQRTVVVLDTPPGDGLSISYSSSDVDDLLASQTQMLDSESARMLTQTDFRRSAENQLEIGAIVSLFC